MKAASSVLWILLLVFIGWAMYATGGGASVAGAGLPDGLIAVKYTFWAAFVAFVAYSIYCSTREDLFRTIKKIAVFHWGRQIGIDLYLGLSLQFYLIYLNEHSVWMALVWFVPTLVYGNIIPLLYIATHFESITAAFH